jgi:phosphoserine phosphatase
MEGDILNNSKVKLIVFDLDGVLVDTVSSWVWVHTYYGVNNDASYEKYMRHEIDDDEFMRSDISLWLKKQKRIHICEIQKILDSVPIMPGFELTIKALNYLDIQIAIVSSGLDPLAQRVGRLGGITHILANGLRTDKNGYLTGEGILKVKLRAKGKPVEQLVTSMGVEPESTIAVGNGETDIPMFHASGLGIAFNPIDDQPAQNADVVIYKKNLTEILKHVCEVDELPLDLRAEC